ncbi:MAG: hypothetical protein NC548_59130, partial [Lachnospiraceae bacterium]|nr:hypothetical protein [Lachnospiraceae bacterium]
DVADIRQVVKVTIGGKEFDFTIKPITETERTECRRQSYVGNGDERMFDAGKFQSRVLDKCIVEPNFKNADFLEKAKCQTAEEFRNRKLPAGVLDDLYNKITNLSGFGTTREKVEEAKN